VDDTRFARLAFGEALASIRVRSGEAETCDFYDLPAGRQVSIPIFIGTGSAL